MEYIVKSFKWFFGFLKKFQGCWDLFTRNLASLTPEVDLCTLVYAVNALNGLYILYILYIGFTLNSFKFVKTQAILPLFSNHALPLIYNRSQLFSHFTHFSLILLAFFSNFLSLKNSLFYKLVKNSNSCDPLMTIEAKFFQIPSHPITD